MSVREQIFVRTDKQPAEVAAVLADLVGGRTEVSNGDTWLLVTTDKLLPEEGRHTATQFGGPVLVHQPDQPLRPVGEYEITDAYTVEIRLWPAGAHNDALSSAAADRVFAAVARTGMAAVQVRNDDELIRAVLPGGSPYDFPAGTLIYETDRDRWNGYAFED